MAAHSPIASAMSSPRPSFAFSRLQDLHATLERLRGCPADQLKIIGFDQLLDELGKICTDLNKLNVINIEMGITDSALSMLLLLLDSAGENPIPPHGLHALLSPVQERLVHSWSQLSDMI